MRIESKQIYVLPEEKEETIICSLRGKFKKDYAMKKDKLYFTDFAAVGDNVEFEMNKDSSGVITKVQKRVNYVSRKAPKIKGASFRGERLEQVVAVNIDNVVVVTSIYFPDFNNRVLDRFLVASESSSINPIIVINKTDLDNNSISEKWNDLYEKIGYKVYLTSVYTNTGIRELQKSISNKKNLFWGHSGVGKSSILNKMFPGLNLKIGEVSDYNSKGKHTTVTANMIKVKGNTFVIDTPGLREIDPYGIQKQDLGHYFIEFDNYMNDCKFNTCTHHHEPGCAIIDAVEKKFISVERYDSYLRMLDTIEEDINF
ncbi:MAG: ribosome small subunit-dependent GTPase A [Ignavibacteria bacterium]|nr:ribosome small subunit-dependent GTPase A [Ignavibacteria bacterium]MBT8382935.1 ribosome small subunit-dependent GTPase A [Ignavibacteria bacterium]MBT8391898.1 ribosome small subunit-dependent GTPase A [Ignavibacteria bacterium]NNJ53306.1 ribosome small subunit-dependent GTPase A [Ignavibacteriaceae bacterium]NNL22244.1 ribosome small subunit-dependent GTPase A [Ignavibacteriaceae bacterium]